MRRPNVKRFAYVSLPSRSVLHRFYGHKFVEGEKTACGISMQAGWPFWYRDRRRTTWAMYWVGIASVVRARGLHETL